MAARRSWIDKMPPTVKISADLYHIESMDPAVAEKEGVWGDIDHTKYLVRVVTAQGRRTAARTLHHEIGHGIARTSNVAVAVIKEVLSWQQQDSGERLGGPELVEVIEEMIVRGTFDPEDAVWWDNPGAFGWIGRGIVRG